MPFFETSPEPLPPHDESKTAMTDRARIQDTVFLRFLFMLVSPSFSKTGIYVIINNNKYL